MIHPDHPVLTALVTDVEAILRDDLTDQGITDRIRDRLWRSLDRGLDLDERFALPRAERYVMYPLYVADDGSFSIASAVWDVGQCTPIHDHGVWGVVGIVSGVEHEIRYERHRGGLEAVDETDFSPGDAVVCCTTDNDLHQVECGSANPCVGIHIYGGDIGVRERHKFDPETGTAKSFVSPWPWLTAPETATSG